MNDKEQKEMPKEQDAADNEDIDNLSQTEKAAFEKIMAQIGEAEDEVPEDSAPSEKPGPSSGDDSDSETPSTENTNPMPDTNTDDAVNDEKSDDDLNDDQRAALDKIMADIGGDDDKMDPGSQEDGDTEGEDQQAALDKIMAETNNAIDGPDEDSDDESLSDDQQAALDQIMAEIGGDDDKVDPGSQEDGDTEGEDQQAALDKIMAETNNAIDGPDEDSDDESLSDDQQAALDQIMAEIDGTDQAAAPPTANSNESVPEKNENGNVTDTAPAPSPATDEAPASKPSETAEPGEAQGLSLEEFDDELSSLLTERDDKNATSTTRMDKGASPVDASMEDLNSALKDIVKESNVDDEAVPETVEEPSPAVLEEIKAASPAKAGKSRGYATKFRKPIIGAGIAFSVIIIAAASFWGYNHYTKPAEDHLVVASIKKSGVTEKTPVPTDQEAPFAANPISHQPAAPRMATAAATLKPDLFDVLKEDILSTRQQLLSKKEELLELKRYYQNGIQQERTKLVSQISPTALTFKAALEKRQIALGLKSIQRRAVYNIKLNTPLARIETYLEELLYLERRTQLFDLLYHSISGLSLTELKHQGSELIQKIQKESEQLSVVGVTATPPSLKSIWQGLSDNSLPTIATTSSMPQLSPTDQHISQAICKGNFEQKYQLTALPNKAAECLAKWPGKDLYLNGLTYLAPEAAKHLAQWPGEWLSLNGIKTISPDVAKYLSQWPGKRLSLNGVARLSAEATAYLSQWQGDQLEMVGLTSIGRWENYVTHLFLSESLRRKLQVQ